MLKKKNYCARNNTKRTWSTPEKKDARELFKKFEPKGNLPSLQMCKNYITEHPSLTGRTPAQLKAWLNNEFLKLKRQQINTTPTKNRTGTSGTVV